MLTIRQKKTGKPPRKKEGFISLNTKTDNYNVHMKMILSLNGQENILHTQKLSGKNQIITELYEFLLLILGIFSPYPTHLSQIY